MRTSAARPLPAATWPLKFFRGALEIGTTADECDARFDRRSRGRLRHPRHARHARGRDPDALPDPRSRRARAQRQEDGRLRQGARHAPPRHGKMHKSVDVAAAAGAPRRRRRRLLPEGLRGRGLRPRRHQGHPGLQRGPRPGQDRPPRPPAEATAPASSSASTTSPTSPTCRRRRRSTAPPSNASSRSTAAPAAAA